MFGTARLGVYNSLIAKIAQRTKKPENALPLVSSLLAAAVCEFYNILYCHLISVAGGIAGLVSTPLDLALVRRAADMRCKKVWLKFI